MPEDVLGPDAPERMRQFEAMAKAHFQKKLWPKYRELLEAHPDQWEGDDPSDLEDWLYRNWLGKAALEYQNQLKVKLADAEARHVEWPAPRTRRSTSGTV
jgi:preprotein translocase subunit SecE